MDTEPRLCHAPMWRAPLNYSTVQRDKCHRSPTDEDTKAQVGTPAPAAAATTQDVALGSGWQHSHLPLQTSSFPSGTLVPIHPPDVFTLSKTLTHLHSPLEVASQDRVLPGDVVPVGRQKPIPHPFLDLALLWMLILEGGGEDGGRRPHPFCSAPCQALPAPVGMCRRYFKDAEVSRDSRLNEGFSP